MFETFSSIQVWPWNLFVVEDSLGLLILLPPFQELGLQEDRAMLGFTTEVCEPEGHWLSVEPMDSKSFLP